MTPIDYLWAGLAGQSIIAAIGLSRWVVWKRRAEAATFWRKVADDYARRLADEAELTISLREELMELRAFKARHDAIRARANAKRRKQST